LSLLGNGKNMLESNESIINHVGQVSWLQRRMKYDDDLGWCIQTALDLYWRAGSRSRLTMMMMNRQKLSIQFAANWTFELIILRRRFFRFLRQISWLWWWWCMKWKHNVIEILKLISDLTTSLSIMGIMHFYFQCCPSTIKTTTTTTAMMMERTNE